MAALEKFDKIYDKVIKALAYLSGIFILIMMFRTTGDVILRNFFKISIGGTYETSQYIYMPMCVLPSLAYIYKSGILPKLDVISAPKNPTVGKVLLILLTVIEAVVFIMLAVYSFESAKMALADRVSTRIAGKQVATWWVYMFCPVGFVTLAIESVLSNLLKLFGADKKAAETGEE